MRDNQGQHPRMNYKLAHKDKVTWIMSRILTVAGSMGLGS